MQNFMQIPPRGASRQMGEIYAKNFLAIYLFFRNSPAGQILGKVKTSLEAALEKFENEKKSTSAAMAQTTWSRARMCLLGVKKFEINI